MAAMAANVPREEGEDEEGKRGAGARVKVRDVFGPLK
jgi:hypothetical protein